MKNNLRSFFGKHVEVTVDDGTVFKGFVQSVESVADSDDGVASIDVVHTKQFPFDILTIRDDEIIEIKEKIIN